VKEFFEQTLQGRAVFLEETNEPCHHRATRKIWAFIVVTVVIPRGTGYQLSVVRSAAFLFIAIHGGGRISLYRLLGKEFCLDQFCRKRFL
jgi:hypothetical protein